MSVNFEQEITQIAALVAPEEQQVRDSTIHIAVSALENMDRKYGPESGNYLLYHNAQHCVDVCRRVVRLLNIVYPYIQPKYQEGVYDLGLGVSANHDDEQGLGPLKNEKASAVNGIARATKIDPWFGREPQRQRFLDGTIATSVIFTEEGDLIQPYIQRGSHDPLKFAISFADINGIAMEGEKRMVGDAIRLCYEMEENPSIDDIYEFLVKQAGFLRERLNDGRVKSDIAYYFPDNIEDVYKGMRKAFHGNILSSYRLALLLKSRPELKNSIGFLLHNVGSIDRSLLGDFMGDVIRKKVSEQAS